MMYSSQWPVWLRVLVVMAVAIVAVASIWGQLRDSKILRAVARELLIKEGEEDAAVEVIATQKHPADETVKSKVSKAAEDSKTALDVLSGFKEEYNTRHMALEDRVKALEVWRKGIDGVVGNG